MKLDVRTRGALAAAALVGAYLVLQSVVNAFVSAATALLYLSGGNGPAAFGSALLSFSLTTVPTVVGVFIGFRLLAPISAQLGVASVLVRSLVAAAAGAVLALVIALAYTGFSKFTGSLFGNSFPFESVGDVTRAWLGQLLGAIPSFVGLVPLVALAAVLLWLWLRKHADAHAV